MLAPCQARGPTHIYDHVDLLEYLDHLGNLLKMIKVLSAGGWVARLTSEPTNLLPHLLITRMRVHRRRQPTHVPGDLSPIIVSQGLAQAHNGRVEGMGELQWRENPQPALSARARVVAAGVTARVNENFGSAGSG